MSTKQIEHTKNTIKTAHELVKKGFSFYDTDKLHKLGYTDEVIASIEDIFASVMCIRMYNISNATVKFYCKVENPPMTLSEIRTYMYETSQLMLSGGHGLINCIGTDELDYATNYLLYEVESNGEETN